MTLDGFCSHEDGIANGETHQHYADLLRGADTLVYGRTTYQMMESYWPLVVKDPTGNKSTDEFAMLIDNIHKVVFSNTLTAVPWKNSRIAKQNLHDELLALKQESGKDVLIGSPGLIAQATNLNVIDEYQIAIHPMVVGKGPVLFKNITNRVNLKLVKTKTFSCGVIVLYYETIK